MLVKFVRLLVGNGFTPLFSSSGFTRGCSGFVFCLVHLAFESLFLGESCFVCFFRNFAFCFLGFTLLFVFIHEIPKILLTPSLINTCFCYGSLPAGFCSKTSGIPNLLFTLPFSGLYRRPK